MITPTANNQRSRILVAVRDRLDALYGPNGTEDPWIRGNIRIGAWDPTRTPRPCVTVRDGGQDAAEPSEPEDSRELTLTYAVMIDLEADWSRDAQGELWSDRVQAIIRSLANWMPPRVGARQHDFTGDEPVEVMIGATQVVSLWVVEFQITYIVPIGTKDKE